MYKIYRRGGGSKNRPLGIYQKKYFFFTNRISGCAYMRMSEEVKIMFKSSKKRQVRRRESSSDEEVEYNKEEYEKTRLLQKLRYFLFLT